MTLASEIVTRSYRETNIIPLGTTPNTAQMTEGYTLLNSLIWSAMGYEAGEQLRDLNYGDPYTEAGIITNWVPDNCRIVANLTAETTLYLDPYPYEGQRIGVSDAGWNFTTYNLFLNGNGKLIERFPEAVLIDDGMQREWMFRADNSSWVAITNLGDDDDFPFPTEFEDLFVLLLASRLNPRYGQTLPPESLMKMARDRSKLRSRYRRTTYDNQTDPGLVNIRDILRYSNTQSFDTGRFWPWPT